MLKQLAHNAVTENRFNDASYYLWRLGIETIKLVQNPWNNLSADDRKNIERFRDCMEKAEIYYAYHFIYRFTEEPFTSMQADSVFNIARYLLCTIGKQGAQPPFGVSKVYVVYALAKQGKALGAYKLARTVFDKLQTLLIPQNWVDQIDLASVTIRSKPFSDKEELLAVCYRCSSTNPLLGNHGDMCINCQHSFVRSFLYRLGA